MVAYKSEIKDRKKQVSTALYYLRKITHDYKQYVIAPVMNSIPRGELHEAWTALCDSYENEAGASQTQVLLTRLSTLKFINTGDIENDFGTLVNLINQTSAALGALSTPHVVDDATLIATLHYKSTSTP